MDLQNKTFTWHDKYCEPNIATHVFSCQVGEDETYKNMLNQLSFIEIDEKGFSVMDIHAWL